MQTTAIIIPARFGSTRFPGKPLHHIEGVPMIARVCRHAKEAGVLTESRVVVATDHQDIMDVADEEGVETLMTSPLCRTGSDRVLDAAQQIEPRPSIIVNLQGDAPLISVDIIVKLIIALQEDTMSDCATPVVRLTWEALDAMREHKKNNPFSGTFAAVTREDKAVWFSKNIIPAIRNEDKKRKASLLSPVFRHLGVYAYRYAALKNYSSMEEGVYEALEGLEQLRFLENDMVIKAVKVSAKGWPAVSGVDSPEDAERVAEIIRSRRLSS